MQSTMIGSNRDEYMQVYYDDIRACMIELNGGEVVKPHIDINPLTLTGERASMAFTLKDLQEHILAKLR